MKLRHVISAFLIFIAAFSPSANATVQGDDPIDYQGEKGWLEERPFGPLQAARKLQFHFDSTANYKGYYAGWKVENDTLVLTDFTGYTSLGKRGLRWLFPLKRRPIVADWFTGTLHARFGKIRLSKVHGHVVATDKMVVLKVKDGKVTSATTYRYPKNIPIVNRLNSDLMGKKFDIRTHPW